MSIKTARKLSFTDFLEQYPDSSGIYELVDGEMVLVEATRAHKNVARFLLFAFNDEIRRLQIDYIVDKDVVIKTTTAEGKERGRNPDVSVVSASLWNANALAYGAILEPLQLAVEVVSTNWEDDYIDKLDEYQRLGIAEYWIVDYLAIASRSYLSYPKVPTISVYVLQSGQYREQRYRGSDRVISPTVPQLELTVAAVVNSSQIQRL